MKIIRRICCMIVFWSRIGKDIHQLMTGRLKPGLSRGRHSGRKNADPWASLIWKPIRSINIIIEFKHICLEILKFSNEILVFGYIKPLYENDLILIKFDIHIVKFSTRRHSEIKNHSCKWFFDPLGTLILPQNRICYSGIDGGRRSSKNLWRPAAFPI